MPSEQERRAAALALLPGIRRELMRSVTKPAGLLQLQTYLNQTEPLTTQQRAELDFLLGIGASQSENLENALYALGSHAQDEFKEAKPEYAALNKARKREVDRFLKNFYQGSFSRIMDAASDSRLPWYGTW